MTSRFVQQGGFRGCKWCHGRGCTFCPGEAAKYQELMSKPIFTARLDNPEEMEQAKQVIGRDAIEHAFGPDGGGIQEIEQNAAITMLLRAINTQLDSAEEKGEQSESDSETV